ncbi:hypothetical protein SUDANB120_05819 [Streptomyces sp. enrichment culture]|uniref:DUF7847 domain-containing protein n=1 Tax=Streptomyces sp. enrichment culture TaxID=1795815 RepID=UPI003F5597ED
MTQSGWPGAHGGGGGAPHWGGWGPPPPPQPGVIPLRPLSLGDIVTGSFSTFRLHWKRMAGVALLVQAALVLLTGLAVAAAVAAVYPHLEPVFDPPFGETPAREHVVPLLVSAAVLLVALVVLGMLGMAVISAACLAVLKEAVSGSPTTFGAVRRVAFRRAPAVAGAMFLGSLVAGLPVFAVLAVWAPLAVATASEAGPGALLVPLVLGLLAAFPVAVWLSVRFGMAPAAVVMEDAGPVAALRRSAALVRGDWWRVFGTTLVGALLAGAIGYAIQLPFNLIGTFAIVPAAAFAEDGVTPAGAITLLVVAFLLTLAGAIAGQLFQVGFMQLVAGLLYADQRIRREGLAEALLAGRAAPPAAPAAAPQPRQPQPQPQHDDPQDGR